MLLQHMWREAGPCCRRTAQRGLGIQQEGIRKCMYHSRRRTGNHMLQRHHQLLSSNSIALLHRAKTQARMRPSSAASPWSRPPPPQQVQKALPLQRQVLPLLHAVQRAPAGRHLLRRRRRAEQPHNRLLGPGKALLGSMRRTRGHRQRILHLRFSPHPSLLSRHKQPSHSCQLLPPTRLGCLLLRPVLDHLCVPGRQALPGPVPMGERG